MKSWRSRKSIAAIDKACAEANGQRSIAIPTGVGFCMYIRRACLDEIGLFDAETFGRGYGEENDFCMRAAAAGWRNVLAGDVFVYHEGAVSFSGERLALTENADPVRPQIAHARWPSGRSRNFWASRLL